MPSPSAIHRKLIAVRTAQRDKRILAVGREIDRWTRAVEERLLGIIAANRGGREGVLRSVDALLIGSVQNAADLLESELRGLTTWSYDSAAEAMVYSLPAVFWIKRLAPRPKAVPAPVGESIGPNFDWTSVSAEDEYERVWSGKATAEEVEEMIRQLEFPPPSPEQIDAILNATSADDGLSAMQRIKTVTGPQIKQLREKIVLTFAGDLEGASAVEALSGTIRELVGNDPGKSTGMNYRAKRIARTEGIRISEAGLRETWQEAGDLIGMIVWHSAKVSASREDHVARDGKQYYRNEAGEFIASDGERLPEIPLGPNCLCWTSAELRSDLTDGLPPAQYGGWYDAAQVRAERDRQFASAG